MPIYIIDTSTGKIIARLAVSGSDRETQLLAADPNRQKVIDNTEYDTENYIYDGAAIVPKPNPTAAEQLAQASSDKRLELARQAEAFIAALDDDEFAIVKAVDPSRTSERYPQYWVDWARGQAELAEQIATHASATQTQIDNANAVIAAYRSVVIWTGKISSGPLAAAYAELAAAVSAADLSAVEAVDLDLSDYKIGAAVAPDPDVTRADLYIPLADVILLES